MLRQLVMSAVMLCGLNVLKTSNAVHVPAPEAREAPADQPSSQDLVDAANELGERALGINDDLAVAAAELASAPSDSAYGRVASLMSGISLEAHDLQTLWRVVQLRYSEIKAEAGADHDDVYGNDDAVT